MPELVACCPLAEQAVVGWVGLLHKVEGCRSDLMGQAGVGEAGAAEAGAGCKILLQLLQCPCLQNQKSFGSPDCHP